jgi:flagellar basal-body rod protein FlgC
MDAAVLRLDVAASNIANAQSDGAVPPQDGTPLSADQPQVYVPRRVDQVSLSSGAQNAMAGGVAAKVSSRASGGQDYELAYRPDASFADDQGMVATPKVDPVEETVQMITAQQAFSANMSVYKTADAMMKAVLDIQA